MSESFTQLTLRNGYFHRMTSFNHETKKLLAFIITLMLIVVLFAVNISLNNNDGSGHRILHYGNGGIDGNGNSKSGGQCEIRTRDLLLAKQAI